MKPLTAGILTAIIGIAGRWAKGESLDPSLALAAGFMVIMLMAFESINEDLAKAFGMLVVVGMIFVPVGDDRRSYGQALLGTVSE